MENCPPTTVNLSTDELAQLAASIANWATELGFDQIGISDTDLHVAEIHLQQWLKAGEHGEMSYMAAHGLKRSRPELLHPGTLRVITARLDYWPEQGMQSAIDLLEQGEQAYISRYALGRDYHKLMRKRLQQLAKRIEAAIGSHNYRVFSDSAPVLEKPLAERSGLGWVGKHTNLINQQNGSWFFLGEVYTDLPLPTVEPAANHCGTCQRCIEVCPTQAITAPYQLDARRCISYLTIELQGAIPLEYRAQIGNRIYGCDDCQLFCPWNRFAQMSREADFLPRNDLDNASLIELFDWSETEFLQRTEGSPIRRLGHQRWLRNIAVAMGNAASSESIRQALRSQSSHPSELVREHVAWALSQQGQ
ncbi:tRNA epoxyqueuosine(34) reductase QueG [Solemya pervernicosa gill symbiont]|uniref:Epoxyqueuosine reductase n=2 Tax=Gammaproteobacteria incertae sedis TaxID=118884 RepID=A0A1T2L7J1_9GAMM|nr:tRNA epoxyqueuosine(34) reductase QueG [Candidatus Reidiella endopervernicosa]OOZ41078.1 tRNA epoxyqueuosine(34) reductase QueG [Solemya pervernicosa gill symbiont]QKQ26239.1 tRNA epoxyqueuosine(34) reductase QueG [Candidatus Reidiella endopervernicosa]